MFNNITNYSVCLGTYNPFLLILVKIQLNQLIDDMGAQYCVGNFFKK